ncbi:MAG: O-antigen ligase family protein [Victivallaceae bacterium]
MKSEINIFEKYLPWLIYVAIFLAYPLVWGKLFCGFVAHYDDVLLIDSATMSLLTVGFCLFSFKRFSALYFSRSRAIVFPGIPVAVFILVCMTQFLLNIHLPVSYLLTSLSWVLIPVFVSIFYREFFKTLPWFMALLWVVSVWQFTLDMFQRDYYYGICGNWNWSAALLAVSTPFFILQLNRLVVKWLKRTVIILLLDIAVLIISLLIIYRCGSKGVNIAVPGALLVIMFVRHRKKVKLRWVLWGVVLFVTFFTVLIFWQSDRLAYFLSKDIRFFLWQGALRLISDNLVCGSGPEPFESAFSPYVPVDYYLSQFATDRSTHPHNHILYIASQFGLLGTISWLWLLGQSIGSNFSRMTKTIKSRQNVMLFTMFFYLILGMIDPVISTWPANGIFLIILGIFIGRTVARFPAKRDTTEERSGISLRLCWSAGIVVMFLCCYAAYCNFVSGTMLRNAFYQKYLKNYTDAVELCDESIQTKMSPQNTYLAALIAFYELKDSTKALRYLDMLKATGYRNYVNNNGLYARALVVDGRPLEALQYFELEQKNFPLSALNLYYYWLTLISLNKPEQAAAIFNELNRVLKQKGMDISMIPVLRKHPGLDIRPYESLPEVYGTNVK